MTDYYLKYYKSQNDDLLEKCDRFQAMYQNFERSFPLKTLLSMPSSSALDRTIQRDTSKIGPNNQELIHFDSNGYLALQNHPKIKLAMHTAIERYGCGTPSVSLLGGTSAPLKALEQKIAAFHQRKDAIIFSSTYNANLGVVSALIRPSDIIYVDEKAHASLHEACKLSRAKKVHKFKSNQLDQLADAMAYQRTQSPNAGILIISDSVFSMQGSLIDLPQLRQIADHYSARILLDECHAVGVIGPEGKGIEDYYQSPHSIDILIGCFSKAFGHHGGYIVGDQALINYLRYYTNSWIFSTAFSAVSAATVLATLNVFQDEPQHLINLKQNTQYLQKLLREQGIVDLNGPSPIVPIPIGEMEKVFHVGQELIEHGIKLGHVGFPAVPRGKSILRMVPTAAHRFEDLEYATDILQKVLIKQ
jgi:glycine C-acetyltransferase